MKGIQELIRPCATLARYEAALAAGTVTQDVMVFIADVRQIRWKGEIYDCSPGIKSINETNGLFALADGFVGEDDEHYYLPHKAPADDKEHTFAMLSDIQGGGGGDTAELEEVSAACLVDLNERLLNLQQDLAAHYSSKDDLIRAQQELTDALLENEEILAEALTSQADKIREVEKHIGDCITRYEGNLKVAKITAEMESDEEVVAYAMADIIAILQDHKRRIYQLEKR